MVESGLESERKVGLLLLFCFFVFWFLFSGFFFHSFSLLPPLSPFLFVDAFLPFMFSIFFSPHDTRRCFFLFFADAPNVTKTTQKDQSFVVYAILSDIPFIFFPSYNKHTICI